MAYQLTMQIDPQGLNQIQTAGQSVVIAQNIQVISESANLVPFPVAWQVFQPLAQNTITWTTGYYPFITTTALQPGNTLFINYQSSIPMQMGYTYTYQNSQFTGSPGGSPNTYNIANQQSGGISNLGLIKSATVNGNTISTPASVIAVLYNQTAHFGWSQTIQIFLSSVNTPGTIIYPPSANALQLTLTDPNFTAKIGFNDSTDEFFQIS